MSCTYLNEKSLQVINDIANHVKHLLTEKELKLDPIKKLLEDFVDKWNHINYGDIFVGFYCGCFRTYDSPRKDWNIIAKIRGANISGVDAEIIVLYPIVLPIIVIGDKIKTSDLFKHKESNQYGLTMPLVEVVSIDGDVLTTTFSYVYRKKAYTRIETNSLFETQRLIYRGKYFLRKKIS